MKLKGGKEKDREDLLKEEMATVTEKGSLTLLIARMSRFDCGVTIKPWQMYG